MCNVHTIRAYICTHTLRIYTHAYFAHIYACILSAYIHTHTLRISTHTMQAYPRMLCAQCVVHEHILCADVCNCAYVNMGAVYPRISTHTKPNYALNKKHWYMQSIYETWGWELRRVLLNFEILSIYDVRKWYCCDISWVFYTQWKVILGTEVRRQGRLKDPYSLQLSTNLAGLINQLIAHINAYLWKLMHNCAYRRLIAHIYA